MALTARAPTQTIKAKLPGGLCLVAGAEITVGATTDYGANGLVLSALAPLIGMTKIIALLQATVYPPGMANRELHAMHDVFNGTIRLYKGATVEITAAADLAAGDILSLSVVGVP